jgi:hypothetical protein
MVFLECHLTSVKSDATTMTTQRMNPKGQYIGAMINAVKVMVAMNAIRATLMFNGSTSRYDP